MTRTGVDTNNGKDSIARCSYDVDMHAQKGQKDTVWKIPYGEYYTIPYRACIPVRFQNLLVAGRCIGSTRIAQASFRIMPVVSYIGEAVGIAGAIASGDSVSVDKINEVKNENVHRNRLDRRVVRRGKGN